MSWVERLKREYGKGSRQLVAYRKTLDQDDPLQVEESKTVGGMISDMNYAIEYMRLGKRPESRRGAETTDAYRYAELRDMDLFPALDLYVEHDVLTDDQKRKILHVLLKLSQRERQCYLLHMAQGLSIAEIGRELKLSKRTAQEYIARAKAKIQQAI